MKANEMKNVPVVVFQHILRNIATVSEYFPYLCLLIRVHIKEKSQ